MICKIKSLTREMNITMVQHGYKKLIERGLVREIEVQIKINRSCIIAICSIRFLSDLRCNSASDDTRV